jgi:hypothetical protein
VRQLFQCENVQKQLTLLKLSSRKTTIPLLLIIKTTHKNPHLSLARVSKRFLLAEANQNGFLIQVLNL